MDAKRALLTFGLCGIVGVLVDIDHLIYYTVTYYKLQAQITGRFLHTPIFIVVGSAIIGICAYIGGLYIKSVLRKR